MLRGKRRAGENSHTKLANVVKRKSYINLKSWCFYFQTLHYFMDSLQQTFSRVLSVVPYYLLLVKSDKFNLSLRRAMARLSKRYVLN